MSRHIISLGGSCDVADQLKRHQIHKDRPNLFFDYLWNEIDGLKGVTKIIRDGFRSMGDPTKHIHTRDHPISIYKQPFSICKDYPNIVFMHHNTTKQEVIESIQRKIKRTKELFENNEPKTFIYYRHYHWDFNPMDDINVILEESIEFYNTFKSLYEESDIKLISLIVYKYNTDKEIINREIKELRELECKIGNGNIKFGYVFRKEDNNKNIITKHEESWDEIINMALQ